MPIRKIGKETMSQFTLNDRFDSSSGEIAHTMIGEGPDVVLVHGTPTSSVVWDGVVARLKERYRFHLLDLPGYGQSEKFEGQEVRLRSFARVLGEWLEAKGLEDPILVGHDFGAGTVLGAHLIEKVPVTAICVSDGVVLSRGAHRSDGWSRITNQSSLPCLSTFTTPCSEHISPRRSLTPSIPTSCKR